jgi:hypothetical protein
VIAVLRWIAIIPAILLAWVTAFASGIGLMELGKSYCPPEDLVSGLCVAKWYSYVETMIFCFSTAFGAALIVGVSGLLAPSRKVAATSVVFAGGIVYGMYFAAVTGLWPSFVSAVIAGALILWVVIRRTQRMVHTAPSPHDGSA